MALTQPVTAVNNASNSNVEDGTTFFPRPFPPLIRWTAVNAPVLHPTVETFRINSSLSPSPSPSFLKPWNKNTSSSLDDEVKSPWTTQSAAQALLDLSYNDGPYQQQHGEQRVPAPSTPRLRFATLSTAAPPSLHDTSSDPVRFAYLPTPPETPERPLNQRSTQHASSYTQFEVGSTLARPPSILTLPSTTNASPRPSLPGMHDLLAQSRKLAIEHGTLLGNRLASAKRMQVCREARARKRLGKSLVLVFARGGVRRSKVVKLKVGGKKVDGGRDGRNVRKVLARCVGDGVV